MRKLLNPIALLAVAGLLLAHPLPVLAQNSNAVVVAACGTPPAAYTAGANRQVTQDTGGRLCGAAVSTPSGTQNENLAQVNGATVNVGVGAAGTGTQRVTTSTDSTIGTITSVTNPVTVAQPTAANLNATVVGTGTFATQSTLQAGAAIIGNVRIDQTAPGTTNGVVATGNVASGSADSGNPVKVGGVSNTTLPTLTNGQRGDLQLDPNGRAIVVTGNSATGTDGLINTLTFGRPDNSSSARPYASALYGFNATGFDRLRTVQGADGTGLGILAMAVAPTSVAAGALVPVVSTVLEGCHVLKASPGNLYTLTVTIQATAGIVQVFNSTTGPGDGAVTPLWAQPVLSNGTFGGDTWSWPIPLRGSVGLTACLSSATTPFTKTASATALFSATVQ